MSIIELAHLRAKAGQEEAMSAALPDALAILATADGCLEATALRGIERPDEFTFYVRWNEVQDHLDFREAPDFARYRAAFSEHLEEVIGFAHHREI